MLASTAQSVGEAVAGFDRSSVEWKLDGIRIQIHRRGDEVQVYTRNLNEITHALPGIVDAVRGLSVERVVLDGEALWMGEGGPAAFQETVAQTDSHAPPEGVVTFLFDPARRRRRSPGHAAGGTPARLAAVAPSSRSQVSSPPTRTWLSASWTTRCAPGHEGVVVKDAASTYGAGRRGKAWRKVKPVRTYDLVVLGAEWGHGRRQGWLSNLHLGARDPGSGGFVMVGKCFKGLTDELLQWQTSELLAREAGKEGIACSSAPSWSLRSRSTVSSPRRAIRAGSRCASRA